MIIGVPGEGTEREKRVAVTPDTVKHLVSWRADVRVASMAGVASGFSDHDYETAGAKIDSEGAWKAADVVLKVSPPTLLELQRVKPESTLITFFKPHQNRDLLVEAERRQISVLAMDCIPRISIAQSMDALSSMANIAGYKAVIAAADLYGGFLGGQITSAGRTDPAKVLVIGAGVAGLSAVSTAKNLGAEVYAFDTRPEAREQVMSVGGKFLTIETDEDGTGQGGYAKEMSEEFVAQELTLIAGCLPDTAIVITTALLPGKKAPVLITKDMVAKMQAGSIIFDLAAEQGGNCELTVKDELTTTTGGVKIAGFTDLPSRLARQSSTFYSNNLYHLLKMITKDGKQDFALDLDNKIIAASLICHRGELRWPPPSIAAPPLEVAVPQTTKRWRAERKAEVVEAKHRSRAMLAWTLAGGAIVVTLLLMAGMYAPPDFLSRLTVFVLACFIGWQVVWNVTPALHTPLMSVTNAISGIIVIGAMMELKTPSFSLVSLLAVIAVLIATVNAAGGFFVTWRMLKMFHK